MLTIRQETPQDINAIRELNTQAFGQNNEAALIDALRNANALTHSLVATGNDKIVGHLASSPVSIIQGDTIHHGLGLGPMAVSPEHQKQGAGKQLINYWLNHVVTEKDNIIVVLGYSEYYPKFGFKPSKLFGIQWEHDVPENVFMVLEVKPGALNKVSGIVHYHNAFNDV